MNLYVTLSSVCNLTRLSLPIHKYGMGFYLFTRFYTPGFIVLIILLFHSSGSVQSQGFGLLDLIVDGTYFVISFQDYSFIVHGKQLNLHVDFLYPLLCRYDLII